MDKFFTWANLHRGPFTSLLGAIIIIASVVSVFSHNRSWTEAAAGIAIGITLVGAPDPKSGSGMGVVGVIALLTMLAVGGCASEKKVLAKYGTQNAPVKLAIQDTFKLVAPIMVETPADSLSTSFSLDSLADATSGDTLKLVSAGGLATLEVWKSPVLKLGGSQRLNARVKVPPQIIHDTIRIDSVVTVYGECPPTYTLAPKVQLTHWQRIMAGYREFCTALVSLALVIALILLGFRLGLFRFLKFLPFLGVVLLLASSSSLVSCQATKPQPKDRPQPMPYWIKRDLHRKI